MGSFICIVLILGFCGAIAYGTMDNTPDSSRPGKLLYESQNTTGFVMCGLLAAIAIWLMLSKSK